MRTKWLVMTALAGTIVIFASGANAMTNTMPAGLAKSADQIGSVEQAYYYYRYHWYRHTWWHRRWWYRRSW